MARAHWQPSAVWRRVVSYAVMNAGENDTRELQAAVIKSMLVSIVTARRAKTARRPSGNRFAGQFIFVAAPGTLR